MEQRSRRPSHGQPVHELPTIPSPRSEPQLETDLPIVDDEIDGDVPAVVKDGLTERERAILTFEKRAWRHAGAKEQAIRDQLDISATRYYQLLNALLDNPAALAHDPVLVGRLRRLRGSRSRARGR